MHLGGGGGMGLDASAWKSAGLKKSDQMQTYTILDASGRKLQGLNGARYLRVGKTFFIVSICVGLELKTDIYRHSDPAI